MAKRSQTWTCGWVRGAAVVVAVAAAAAAAERAEVAVSPEGCLGSVRRGWSKDPVDDMVHKAGADKPVELAGVETPSSDLCQ